MVDFDAEHLKPDYGNHNKLAALFAERAEFTVKKNNLTKELRRVRRTKARIKKKPRLAVRATTMQDDARGVQVGTQQGEQKDQEGDEANTDNKEQRQNDDEGTTRQNREVAAMASEDYRQTDAIIVAKAKAKDTPSRS